MNKLSSLLVVGVVSLFMSSCFLFRTHEGCPAYGDNVEKKSIENQELSKEEILQSEDKNKV